jgi:hypothetical protein
MISEFRASSLGPRDGEEVVNSWFEVYPGGLAVWRVTARSPEVDEKLSPYVFGGTYEVFDGPEGLEFVMFKVWGHYEYPGTLSDGFLTLFDNDSGTEFRAGGENLPQVEEAFDLVSVDGENLPTKAITLKEAVEVMGDEGAAMFESAPLIVRGWLHRYSDQTWTWMTVQDSPEVEEGPRALGNARAATVDMEEGSETGTRLAFTFDFGLHEPVSALLSDGVITFGFPGRYTDQKKTWVFHKRR